MNKIVIRGPDGTQEIPSSRAISIKYMCQECFGWEGRDGYDLAMTIKTCDMEGRCFLWDYRYGSLTGKSKEIKQAIINECHQCYGGDKDGLLHCPTEICPLYTWRLGARSLGRVEG